MKAVVLAAGEGKRLRPFTLTRPKALLPIANKPLLEHLLESLKACGFSEVLIVVGYRGEQIRNHFGDGSPLGVKLTYLLQRKLRGTADALALARELLGDEPFLAVYGDLLVRPDAIRLLLQKYRELGSTPLLTSVRVGEPEQYGVLRVEGDRVLDLVEKPEVPPSNLANAGIYVFSEEIFRAIRETRPSPRGELELTDSVRRLIQQGRVSAVEIPSESWMDIGRPWDLLEANERLLKDLELRLEGEVEPGATLLGPVKLGAGSRIRSGSYVEGPILIGSNCDIGPNCYLRPHTSIGNSVRIGNACEVKNSIVMDSVHIAHLSYVADSVIGEGCNLGAGSITANLRFDEATVRVRVEQELMDSRRRKLGAFLGDRVKVGVGAMFMPGVKVGPESWVGPGAIVYRDLPARSRVLVKQVLK